MSARNQKLLNSKELDTILSLLLFHFEDRWNTEKPFTQESFVTKSLRVARKHLPNLREGDTPQGRARVSKLSAKTSRNQIPDVDLGAVLPRRASGCVGCRRRENIRITGFSRSRRNRSL